MNTDIQNKTSAPEANSPQPTTNEEILSLLRKLVEQNETDKTNVSDKTEPSHGNAQDDNTAEIKRLLAELLKKQTNNAPRPKRWTTISTMISTTMTKSLLTRIPIWKRSATCCSQGVSGVCEVQETFH